MTELILTTAPLVDCLQQMAAREQTTAEALLVEAVTEFLARDDQNGLSESDESYGDTDQHVAFLQEKAAFQRLKPALLTPRPKRIPSVWKAR